MSWEGNELNKVAPKNNPDKSRLILYMRRSIQKISTVYTVILFRYRNRCSGWRYLPSMIAPHRPSPLKTDKKCSKSGFKRRGKVRDDIVMLIDER